MNEYKYFQNNCVLKEIEQQNEQLSFILAELTERNYNPRPPQRHMILEIQVHKTWQSQTV
jgi:hypothetical protein